MNDFDKIKEDFKSLNNQNVVIYGSYLSNNYIIHRSDIDIAVITQEREKKGNIIIWKKILGEFDEIYDIKIFELLPLFIQIEIIKNYRVLFGDKLEISEYFYFYRKRWKDMEKRIELKRFNSIREKINLLEHRKL